MRSRNDSEECSKNVQATMLLLMMMMMMMVVVVVVVVVMMMAIIPSYLQFRSGHS